jgi:hypothetical protein
MATQQEIDAARAWNTNFSNLNNIPVNNRTEPIAYQEYNQKLLDKWKATGQYKDPDAVSGPITSSYGGFSQPTQPTGLMSQSPTGGSIIKTTQTPEQQQTFQQGMGVNTVNGQNTFEEAGAATSSYDPNWLANRQAAHTANPTTSTTNNSYNTNAPAATTPGGTPTGNPGVYIDVNGNYAWSSTAGGTTPAGPTAPAVSSATPTSHGQGLVDYRLGTRGLPPQTPATPPATGGGNTGNTGNTGGLMSTPNTVAPVSGQVGYEARQMGDPTQWNVTDDQTVAGQVRNLINENNPLQQQAATRAKQQMNQNGMLNSSMAIQAGQAAMYDAALPIAQADAATYGRSAAYNADEQNQFAVKNVDATNTALNATAGIRANTARDTAQTIAQANLTDKQAKIAADAAALKVVNDIATVSAGAANQKDLEELRASISRATTGADQTAKMSGDLTATINRINESTVLDQAGKALQIREAIKAANQSFAMIHAISGMVGPLLTWEEKVEAPSNNGNGTPANGLPKIAGENGNPAVTQSTFDSAAYYAQNGDVRRYYESQPGGATPDQAWAHYIATGQAEGRKAFLK